MWTRTELKASAKEHLKVYYWQALLVTFLVWCITSGVSGSNIKINLVADQLDIVLLFMEYILKIALLSFIIEIFFGNIITVGMKKFFLCARLRDVSIAHLFDGFRGGNYGNVLLTMLIRSVKIFLWSLLFIIPGIIKIYEYYMVPYILAEEPNIDRKEAFRRSKIMMEGEKWNTFVLELSFIGWYILGAFACCIGEFFVAPYSEVTRTELYDRLRTKILPSHTEAQPFMPTDLRFE